MSQLALFSPAETHGLPAPIPAKCTSCGWNATGRDAVVSPTLAGCRCFWCSSELRHHKGEKDFARADKHCETPMFRRMIKLTLLDNGIVTGLYEIKGIAQEIKTAFMPFERKGIV